MRITKPALALALLALACGPARQASAQTPRPPAAFSYEALTAAQVSATSSGDSAEIDAALAVITDSGRYTTAKEVADSVKASLPKLGPARTVRLTEEMIAGLVKSGDDYDKLVSRLTPALRHSGMAGQVIPVLFKSEVPYFAMMPDGNAVVVSTRALALLDDDETEAIGYHEIVHDLLLAAKREATDRGDKRTLRVIELICDAGAAAMLAAQGKDTKSILTGNGKMQQVLEIDFGQHERKGDHPTLKTRAALVKEAASRLGQLASK